MPVFFIPPEYYGAVGLSKGIGEAANAANEAVDTIRRRRNEDMQKASARIAMREQMALSRNDPANLADMQLVLGAQTGPAQETIPFLQRQQFNAAQATLNDPNATAQQKKEAQALINRTFGLGVLGISGELTAAENQQELGGLQVEGARSEKETRKQKEERLAKEGKTPGGVQAENELLGLRTGEAQIGAIRANTAESYARVGLIREQTNSERAQQQLIRANIRRVEQEITAASRSARADPLATANLEYMSYVAKDLASGPNALHLPGGLTQLQAGLARRLPPEEQAAFDQALAAQRQSQLQLHESKLAEGLTSGNATQRAAAARLKAIRDNEKATGRSTNISADEMYRLEAAAFGMSVREVRGRFWGTKLEMVPAEASPTGTPVIGRQGGPTYNPATLTQQAAGILRANGNSYEKARATILSRRGDADARRPGYTDALLAQLDASVPAEARTPAQRPAARNAAPASRPTSTPAPAREPAPRYSSGGRQVTPTVAPQDPAKSPITRLNAERSTLVNRIGTMERQIATATTVDERGRRRYLGNAETAARTRQLITQKAQAEARLERIDRDLEKFK